MRMTQTADSLGEGGELRERRRHANLVILSLIPAGTFSQTNETSVPSGTTASVVVTVIAPAKAGSSDSNATPSTIRSPGTSSRKRPWNTSALSEVLPRAVRSVAVYTNAMRKLPPSRGSNV
jgi:hypothetical protein